MEPSIFTKIISGEIPCYKVYEDEYCIAFLDIHPLAEGHVLLVPKEQIDHLWDLSEEVYAHLWERARFIAPRLQEVIGSNRVGVIVEGFGVPHAHIHLIPINNAQELKKSQDLESEPDHYALSLLAEKIGSEL